MKKYFPEIKGKIDNDGSFRAETIIRKELNGVWYEQTLCYEDRGGDQVYVLLNLIKDAYASLVLGVVRPDMPSLSKKSEIQISEYERLSNGLPFYIKKNNL